MGAALSALLAFLVAVALHALLVRVLPDTNRVVGFAAVAVAVALPCAALALTATPPFAAAPAAIESVAAAAVYGFLCELYVFAFTTTMASVAVSLLVDGRAPDPRSGAEMTAERIARLLEVGLLREHDGKLAPSPRGRLFVRVYRGFRSFFGHDAASR